MLLLDCFKIISTLFNYVNYLITDSAPFLKD